MKEFLSPDIFIYSYHVSAPWDIDTASQSLLGLKEQTGYMAGRENCTLEALLKS